MHRRFRLAGSNQQWLTTEVVADKRRGNAAKTAHGPVVRCFTQLDTDSLARPLPPCPVTPDPYPPLPVVRYCRVVFVGLSEGSDVGGLQHNHFNLDLDLHTEGSGGGGMEELEDSEGSGGHGGGRAKGKHHTAAVMAPGSGEELASDDVWSEWMALAVHWAGWEGGGGGVASDW